MQLFRMAGIQNCKLQTSQMAQIQNLKRQNSRLKWQEFRIPNGIMPEGRDSIFQTAFSPKGRDSVFKAALIRDNMETQTDEYEFDTVRQNKT